MLDAMGCAAKGVVLSLPVHGMLEDKVLDGMALIS